MYIFLKLRVPIFSEVKHKSHADLRAKALISDLTIVLRLAHDRTNSEEYPT